MNLFRYWVASVTRNAIFVAPVREFLKYIRCFMIMEGCNETLNMVLPNIRKGE